MPDIIEIHERLRAKLIAAQEQRNQRKDWVDFEHQTLLTAVNEERQQLHKSPITMAQLNQAEIPALGHVDYTSKFALYAAEMVLDQNRCVKTK